MTLRPIEPIDTRGLVPRTPSTGIPIFEMADPKCDARFRGGQLAVQCAPCAYGKAG